MIAHRHMGQLPRNFLLQLLPHRQNLLTREEIFYMQQTISLNGGDGFGVAG